MLYYIEGMKYRGILYNSKKVVNEIFINYSDVAFIDDLETRVSSYSFVFLLFGGVIHFKSTK